MAENRKEKQENRICMVTDYGRDCLLSYADSFRSLADSYGRELQETDREEEIAEETPKEGDGGRDPEAETAAKYRLLESRCRLEDRRFLSSNLKEISHVMEKVAHQAFPAYELEAGQKKAILQELKKEKIRVRDICCIGLKPRMVNICMSSGRGSTAGTRVVTEILSWAFQTPMTEAVSTAHEIGPRFSNYLFTETPAFMVLTGNARATKEGEKVSGDNHMILRSPREKVTAVLCDGMGSGEEAGKGSRQVLELLEQMLEAQMDVDAAMELVSQSVATAEGEAMHTLDICSLDLYKGMSTFYKRGAASSYLKSNQYVEEISIPAMPLGVSLPESRKVTREIMGGDYIVMVTDGVPEALSDSGYETAIKIYLESMTGEHPAAMAAKLLQFVLRISGGKVKDDMTVLVLGIYERRP